MEETRNLCAHIPISLHTKVIEEKTVLNQSLSEYVTEILKEHFVGGKTIMIGTKTLAVQIPEDLDQRMKAYLAAEKERIGKKISQREFIIRLIEKALEEIEQESEE